MSLNSNLKKVVIIILTVIAIIVASFIVYPHILKIEENEKKYKTALTLMEHYQDIKALEKFKEIKDYKNSKTMINKLYEKIYTSGQNNYKYERLHKSKKYFQKILEYKDSKKKVDEILREEEKVYKNGILLIENNKLDDALGELTKVYSYKDSIVLSDYLYAKREYEDFLRKDTTTTATLISKCIDKIPDDYQGDLSELILKSKKNIKKEINEKKEEKEIKIYITRDKPRIGMTKMEVEQSTWGYPYDINKTTTEYGVNEQWVYKVYNNYKYVYLDDGIVTAIQE